MSKACANWRRIQEAVERAGVRFTEDEGDGFGVRLIKKVQMR
jgi:hypothetical protein